MALVEQQKHLFAPPYSEEVETYILPIAKNEYEIPNGLKIAGGWRYFDNIRVLQKKKNNFIEVLISVKELRNLAKRENKESLRKVDIHLENIIIQSSLLIACHGSVSHVAAAKSIRQIDIIDKSYNYSLWTAHFRNYQSLNRSKFNILSRNIINLLDS